MRYIGCISCNSYCFTCRRVAFGLRGQAQCVSTGCWFVCLFVVWRTLMQLPIAELTYDELHSPLGPDERAIAQRAVATDAIRPTHTYGPYAQPPEHRNTPLVNNTGRHYDTRFGSTMPSLLLFDTLSTIVMLFDYCYSIIYFKCVRVCHIWDL